MLNQLLRLEWVNSFVYCSVIQMYLEKIGVRRRTAQLVSCIIFQIYFVYIAFTLTYYEYISNKSDVNIEECTIKNMNDIYGYFIYDTIYLITDNRNILFIVHHIASLVIISVVRYNITPYHNILCFLAEIQNPILNSRYLTSDYPILKRLNKTILYWAYIIFRITLFPIFSIMFLRYMYDINKIYFLILSLLFIGLYSASVLWFKKISKL